MSSYAPDWVKRDTARFPRARLADGRAIEMLSPFAPANADADARAFAALMAHLAVSDRGRTVLLIQVENEIGMIPEPRDRSEEHTTELQVLTRHTYAVFVLKKTTTK